MTFWQGVIVAAICVFWFVGGYLLGTYNTLQVIERGIRAYIKDTSE